MSAQQTYLHLTDDELVVLDGRCRPVVQAEVDAAAARIAAVAAHTGMDPRHAALIADVISWATTNGAVRWVSTGVASCTLCDDKPYAYHPYKSGPNRGLNNLAKPKRYAAIELGRSHTTGFVKLGGCQDCMTALKPHLVAALADVRCQVPNALAASGRPDWRRYDNRRCTVCDWTGHEGQMGKDRTIMGDGWVPSFCPACGAGGVRLFGPRPVEHADEFTVTLPGEYVHEQRFKSEDKPAGIGALWPIDHIERTLS